jgi:deoxyribonuclease V
VSSFEGMADAETLEREQLRLACLTPPLWRPGPDPLVAAAGFVAFVRGEQGPGQAGDRAFVGAAATLGTAEMARAVVEGDAPAPYQAGLLAAREGALLEAALRALGATGVDPDVVLVDATGRDHPRQAGLAMHLGAVLGVPTIGVTHRPLLATGATPPDEAGASSELLIGGVVVGRWLRTQRGVRPLAVHAGWRTDDQGAVEVVMRLTASARTPEPLRLARMVAREERARHEQAEQLAGGQQPC